jgi:non-specific serine/threonine protein kinase
MHCDLARYAGELGDLHLQIEEALQMAEQLAYTAGMAKGKQLLAVNIAYTTDNLEAAIPYDLSSVALWRQLDSQFELATALNLLGADLMEIHESAAAKQALLECRDIYQSLGYRRGVALATHNLGDVAQMMGAYANARALLCESLRIRHHLGLQRGYAYSFESLAQVNEKEGRDERAVQLWAAADTLRVRLGAPLEQVTQKYIEDALPRSRARLGDVAFELAWSKGATMTTEQAIALALS